MHRKQNNAALLGWFVAESRFQRFIIGPLPVERNRACRQQLCLTCHPRLLFACFLCCEICGKDKQQRQLKLFC
ncbi:hypothetical protein L596_004120 [Steinernema carpocapsae]|uniref:Uncharacterized protein n=1 Tax=Steinernema carpocapsae TaxID=34508 RepID=A0A4U8UUP8_STECR|nr:hypothetical protein L596_004120 [Steinernema carpocapsae]